MKNDMKGKLCGIWKSINDWLNCFDQALVREIERMCYEDEVRKRPTLSTQQTEKWRKKLNTDLIAHALGGGIGYTYSNSAQALCYSSRCGYDSVEVDVRFTSDNKLVCSHDFNTSYVPSYDEFMTEQYEPRFTTLDFEECISFCRNKGLKLIVDTKNRADVEKVAAYLLRNHRSKDDVWIQIFNEDDISHVNDLNVLYNLTFESNYDRAADFCSAFGVNQVSISTKHLRERKGWEVLINRGIDVYAHTVNDRCEYWEYKQVGVRGVFTDKIERKELE